MPLPLRPYAVSQVALDYPFKRFYLIVTDASRGPRFAGDATLA
jgi:hypothetical protein